MSDSLQPHDYIVHGILQARILEWVAYPFSSGSSQPRNWTGVSCITGGFFTNWAIREAPWTGRRWSKRMSTCRKERRPVWVSTPTPNSIFKFRMHWRFIYKSIDFKGGKMSGSQSQGTPCHSRLAGTQLLYPLQKLVIQAFCLKSWGKTEVVRTIGELCEQSFWPGYN